MNAANYNSITSDPQTIDPLFPADMQSLVFDSHGSKIHGLIYLAQGAGPHPTAILLHGLPGNERNLDLAQAIRRAGWNVVYFNYRGSWGSEGTFSLQHIIEDTLAVLAFLRSSQAAEYRVDPETTALIGHSMGGACALAVAIQDPSVQYVASLSGVNWGQMAQIVQNDPSAFASLATSLEEMASPLTGFSGEARLNELISISDQVDVKTNAKTLAAKTILLVGGSRDQMITLDSHYWPMLRALQAENASRLTHKVFDDDHHFSSHRIALAQLVATWLNEQCRKVVN